MVLPPKPPPISAGMARMSLCGMPVKYAVMARTMNWPWLELQIVVLLSAPTLTRQACGSIKPLWPRRGGGEPALDDDFGLFEPLRDVTLLDLEPAADVRRLAFELHEVVKDRSVR